MPFEITNETIAQEMAETGWQPQPKPQAKPLDILRQQEERQSQQLMNAYRQNHGQITRDTEYKLQSLARTYEIKKKALMGKYGRHDVHVDPEVKAKYDNDLRNLETQYQVTAEQLSSRIQPDLDSLEEARTQGVSQLQQMFNDKRVELQTIERMQNEGLIRDPADAMRAQYKVLGIDAPVQRQITPRQELNEIERTLRMVKSENEIDWIGGEDRELDPAMLQLEQDLRQKKIETLKRIYPQYSQALEAGNRLSRGATTALVGDGQHGGTLAGRVTAAKNQGIVGKTPQQPVMRARNPQTGQRIVSNDGGKTWQIAQ